MKTPETYVDIDFAVGECSNKPDLSRIQPVLDYLQGLPHVKTDVSLLNDFQMRLSVTIDLQAKDPQ